MPRRSWAARGDGSGHGREHGGLRVAGREGELDPALELLDALRCTIGAPEVEERSTPKQSDPLQQPAAASN